MQGTQMLITDIFESNSGIFVIPVFQRNYEWRIEQCERLMQDLEKLIPIRRQNASAEHFFGSTVRKIHNSSKGYETMLIDGQQRIVTTTLLLLALRDTMNEKLKKGSLDPEEEENYRQYISDANRFLKERRSKNIRFHLSLRDNPIYESLVLGKEIKPNDTHIYENYQYMLKRLATSDFDPSEWFEAVYGLRIIDIRLDEGESAQEIFESLNSTGLALTHSDMIRNYLLMDLPQDKQDHYYQTFWLKIEDITNENGSSDAFFRDFLTMKNQEVSAKGAVYSDFRAYAKGKDIEHLSDEIMLAAECWGWINGKTDIDSEIASNMKHLKTLNLNVIRPYLLVVAEKYYKDQISAAEFNAVLQILESYLVRYKIAGDKTAGLNTMMAKLDREITNLEQNTARYPGKLAYKLLAIDGDRKFHNDAEFLEDLKTYRFRTSDRELLIGILDRLENLDTKEGQDILDRYEQKVYSIEHIMPQKLNKDWVADLGEDYQRTHELLLNSLGNLTVTAYNSQYSNQSFDKKKNGEDGFKKSGIRLNRPIADKPVWGKTEILERLDSMSHGLLKAYPYPQTDYQPPERIYISIGLNDSWDPNYYPVQLNLKETIFDSLKNMKNVLEISVRDLYMKKPNAIQKFAQTASNFLSRFAKDADYVKIADNVYLNTHMSNADKLSYLKRLYRATDTPLSEFSLDVGIRNK